MSIRTHSGSTAWDIEVKGLNMGDEPVYSLAHFLHLVLNL